ncbi:hypothetical protein GCM10027594_04840 [Hymenobacter agri]
MNKLIHTDPPSALGRWLARSVASAMLCVGGLWLFWHYAVVQTLAFAPGLGAVSMTQEGHAGRNLTVLATLVVVGGYFVFTQAALSGFHAAYASEKYESPGLGQAALGWCTIAHLLKWAWLVFAVFVVLGCLLSITDEGRTWN